MIIIPYTTFLRRPFTEMLTSYFDELDSGIPDHIVRGSILELFEQLQELQVGHVSIALHRGKPIGFALYQIDSERSDWCKYPGWGCIREFYIEKAYRGRGYGTRMAAYAEKQLRKLGASRLYLTADDAVRFWEKCGYSNTHEICSNDLEIFTK